MVALASAKTGQGVRIAGGYRNRSRHRAMPRPQKALIFDSHFDPYRGNRIYESHGRSSCRQAKIKLMATDKRFEITG